MIKLLAQSKLPTKYGDFLIRVYKDKVGHEHVALVKGVLTAKKPTLVRVHSECLTGEVFHSIKCDCREQLASAMKIIGKSGGVIIYLRQEGRGIGLGNKIKAYYLQDQGYDTVDANTKLGFAPDLREYKIASLILKDLNINKIKILTNNPLKVSELKKFGIKVIERVALEIKPHKRNFAYLTTKKKRMGHLLKKV